MTELLEAPLGRASSRDFRPSTVAAALPSIEEQIRSAWSQFDRQRSDPPQRPDLFDLRCKRVERMYKTLATEGFDFKRVTDLTESAARALLARWRKDQLAAVTIRSQWSVLRVWVGALGKDGLIKPLSVYWGEVPKASSKKKTAGSVGRHSDLQLEGVLAEGQDKTHYWIERACRILRISAHDAIDLVPDEFETEASAGSEALRAPGPDLESRAQLIAELRRFLFAAGRPTLRWAELSPRHALRRHENHVAYVRRKMRTNDEGET